MAVNIILSASLNARFIGSTQEIHIQWVNHLLCANHYKGTWGVRELSRATCSRIDNSCPRLLLPSIKYTTEHKTGRKKKKVFGEFLVPQKKSITLVFETYFPLDIFTAHHIFQWMMFNNWVAILFKSQLFIDCWFHRTSKTANQIIFTM